MSEIFRTFLSQPLFNALIFLHEHASFGDLGVAIILLTISVRLILFPLFHKTAKHQRIAQEKDLSEEIAPLLEEVAKDNALRDSIVNNGDEAVINVKAFLEKRIDASIVLEIVICNPDELCSLEDYPNVQGEVYSGERIISASLDKFSLKKVKLYLWRK